MTFKEYFAAIQKNHEVFAIQEHRADNKVIATYVMFSYTDPDDNGMVDFGLYQNDDYFNVFIDPNQTVELKPNSRSIFVMDRDGNKLELTFFAAQAIEHPKMKNPHV